MDDPVKLPEVQDLILGNQIGCIAYELSKDWMWIQSLH